MEEQCSFPLKLTALPCRSVFQFLVETLCGVSNLPLISKRSIQKLKKQKCFRLMSICMFFRAFTETLPRVPLLILASADSGAAMFFASECSKNLITEGNTLADKLGARFMTTTANFQNQGERSQSCGANCMARTSSLFVVSTHSK